MRRTPCQIRTDDILPEKQRGWTATLMELTLTISVSIVVLTEAFLKEGLLLLCPLDCPVEQDHDQKADSDYQKNDVDEIHDLPLLVVVPFPQMELNHRPPNYQFGALTC